MSEENKITRALESESADVVAGELTGMEQSTTEAVTGQGIAASRDPLTAVATQFEKIEQMLSGLTEAVTTLSRNQEIMQGAIRQLSVRVSEAAMSLSAPRMRELYLRLLLIYDLISPLPAGLSDDARHMADVLATQIEEFLAVNGFERIPTNGELFDPKLHKPLEFVTTEDSSMDGRVTTTSRTGFRSGGQVLRPAEVWVARAAIQPSESKTQEEILEQERRNENGERIEIRD